VRRSPDGHQTPILTSRADLPAAEICYRMSARWRQENYFRYGRQHFALDALDSYADHGDDLTRPVPNPAKARAQNAVVAARTQLAAANADLAAAIDTAAAQAGRPGSRGKAVVDPGADRAVAAAKTRLARANTASRNTPATYPWARSGPAAGNWKPNANCSPTPFG